MKGPQDPMSHPNWGDDEPDRDLDLILEEVSNKEDFYRGRVYESIKQAERIDSYSTVLSSLLQNQNFASRGDNMMLRRKLQEGIPSASEILLIIGTIIAASSMTYSLSNILTSSRIINISPASQITLSLAAGGLMTILLSRYFSN